MKNMRHIFCALLQVSIATLPHHVAVDGAALCRIDHIFAYSAEHPVHGIVETGRAALANRHCALAK
jgi:hypothetical protein